MTSYTSIIRADYLQRTRSYGFMITMLLSICLAYTFVPPDGANYATVRVGNFTGENNAAWIGHVTAIMASTFLWLIGYYLVNNGIRKDRETGVGQIIATTSISNFKYLLAKAISNFLVLLTITGIVMGMALVLVMVRGGQFSFDASQFFLPYFVATIPSIFLVAIVAVVGEVLLGRFSNLQNIAFFFLFAFLVNTQMGSKPGKGYWWDIFGTRQLTDGMVSLVRSKYSSTPLKVSSGFIFNDTLKIERFLFTGTQWKFTMFTDRLLLAGLGMLLLFIVSLFFNRFDEKAVASQKKKKKEPGLGITQSILKDIHLAGLPVAQPDSGSWTFIKMEGLMLLRKGPRWFWLINIGGWIALWFLPLEIAHRIGLPVLWFLQINRWADIATKEKFYGTHYFTYAAFQPLKRLLSAQVLSAILLSISLALPVICRQIYFGEWISAIAVILGAMIVVSLAVCSGIVSGGKRLFEVVFFLLTYLNVTGAPPFDYFGGFNRGGMYLLILLVILMALLVIAFLRRNHEISHQ